METLGQRLRRAREARRLTIAQAAEATRIRAAYLEALENDDLSQMPSAVQARGFLRLYAGFLGLDVDQMLAELRRAQSAPATLTGPGLPPVSPPPAQEERPTPPPAKKEDPPRRPPAAARPPAKARPRPVEAEAALPAAPAPSRPSAQIFAAIGESLRARRELLGLNLDDIEQHTRVRRHYLQALEEGALDRLPSPVQTRGMLSNYAAFLEMDVDGLLLRFAEGLQARHQERLQTEAADGRKRREPRLPFRTFLAADLVFGVGIIALLIFFGVWAVGRIAALQAQRALEATPPPYAIETFTPTALPTPAELTTPETSAPTPALTAETPALALTVPAAGGPLPVQVKLLITERTLLRVSVDGQVQLDGRVLPGSTYVFQARERIEILTGNAAAVRVEFNGRDLGLMGGFGQVSNLIYSLGGIQTPTATPLPTATATPRTSPTPTRTPTATPTPAATLQPGP